MPFAHIVEPGTKVDLGKIDPGSHGGLEKEEAHGQLGMLSNELSGLQELMYAARDTALLCVFQGMDTAGKDGAINKVLSYVNVQSCRATYFKVPTAEELSHDFLWRVHSQTPPKGGITLFNRSHYEDVVVVRVHDLVPKDVWRARYDRINAFEALLAENDTIVLKFFLHISKGEQEQRLLEREADPMKAWKLSVQDWKERDLWHEYMEAYEDALTRCSTKHAPWRIVPANHKWFRDLAIAEAIADSLRPCGASWKKHLEEVGAKAKAELARYRQELRQSS